MALGTVKVWSPARGSGWIMPDGRGDRVYVHKSGIVRGADGKAPILTPGQRVEFQIGPRPKGSAAINVQPAPETPAEKVSTAGDSVDQGAEVAEGER